MRFYDAEQLTPTAAWTNYHQALPNTATYRRKTETSYGRTVYSDYDLAGNRTKPSSTTTRPASMTR